MSYERLPGIQEGKLQPDYRKLPYEKRPVAMRLLENMLKQPVEEIMVALFYKHRRIKTAAKELGISGQVWRKWADRLGLFTCSRCSFRTGRYFLHSEQCSGCKRWFCDGCIELEHAHRGK